MIEKFEYSTELTEAAEQFMLACFTSGTLTSEIQPVLVEAAMNIINGDNYMQPSHPSYDDKDKI